MDIAFTLAALSAPLALGLAACGAKLQPGSRPRQLQRVTSAASLWGVLVSAALALYLSQVGTWDSALLGTNGLGLSLRFDALSVLIVSMVSGLGAIVLRYSSTYLEGDSRQGTFLGRLCLTIASVELLVLSGNVVMLVLAWIATSLSLHQLLLFYPERARAVTAAKKKFIVARIGDVCLVGAAALLYARFGTGQLGELFALARQASSDARVEGATVLLAVAALLKSAQFPTHGWLVEVMETPTPVSALLHAGILNAGPYVVMRFASVMELGAASAVLLVLLGGFTALFASVVLTTQPSVKVALGYSSAAHMGFMLLVCGLGVYPAAVLHLVAHSFYKAHAFLAAGSAVEIARSANLAAPSAAQSPGRVLGGLGLALAMYAATAALLGLSPQKSPALLVVGAVLVLGLTQLLVPVLDARLAAGARLRTLAWAAGVSVAFFGLEEGARVLLASAFPAPATPSPLVLALASAVLVTFAIAVMTQASGMLGRSPRLFAAYVHLRNGLYANAYFDRLVGALAR
jgi:NAD(P)H-quinone oxidoreductase subunit 5